MGLDDLVSTESAVVATATAAVFSPKTRETLRKGAVYGVAGALKVGDVVTGAARGVVNGVRGEQQPSTAAASAANGAGSAPVPRPATTSRSTSRSRSSGGRSNRSAGAAGS